MAQTTVTSSGRDGTTACLDQPQVNAGNLPITALSTTSVTVTPPQVTWNQFVSRLGDTTPPQGAVVRAEVFNAQTKVRVGAINSIGIISSSIPNTPTADVSLSGLAAKTNYYVEVYTLPSGSIPKQVFARRCFMTGGTYTMTVDPNTSGQSSGCFAISEFKGTIETLHHVRNCWCGRENTLPMFRRDQDNLDWLNMWNCL